jgi:hypothetical protein
MRTIPGKGFFAGKACEIVSTFMIERGPRN